MVNEDRFETSGIGIHESEYQRTITCRPEKNGRAHFN